MAARVDPPYLRIAAELRRRIADGELAPGDRVPSTRQITHEWGVALATATKALATLRREGLVLAKPRAGHVVSRPGLAPARRHGTPDHELNRERGPCTAGIPGSCGSARRPGPRYPTSWSTRTGR